MAFVEEVFPIALNYGSRGGPGFSVSIIENDSGKEERVGRWSTARRVYDASAAVRRYDQLYTLQEFYIARGGPLVGFRFEDPLDHNTSADGRRAAKGQPDHAADDVVIGVGDASETDFQLIKRYADGAAPKTRTITKPISGTVLIAVDGVTKTETTDYSVNYATGVVTFVSAPGSGLDVTAGFEFHTPVRFAEETNLEISADDFSTGSAPRVGLVEEVDDVTTPEEAFNGGAKAVQTISGDVTISVLEGRVRAFDPQTANVGPKLPATTDLAVAEGGPIFFILNEGAVDLDIKDNAASTLLSVPAGGRAVVVLGVDNVGTRTWYIF